MSYSETIWSAVETTPWNDCVATDLDALAGQLAYVGTSSELYRRKFTSAGLSDRTLGADDLSRIPFTFKAELRDSFAAAPPLGEHLAADPQQVVQIQATSGTTGRPTYLPVTAADVDVWNEMTSRALFAGGVRPGDRILSAFSQARGLTGGLPMNDAYRYMGACAIPIGAEAGSERMLQVMADLRPDVWTGAPYFALYLAEQAPRLLGVEARELGLRCLIVGGEPGGGIPAVRRRLVDAWDASVAEMMGASDIGLGIWNECAEGDGMHFCAQGLVLPELIEPETGAALPLEQGVVAEIVYTSLKRQAAPLIRFRIGDMLEVVGDPETCACGRTSPRVRCVGRTDDMLIVKGMNVWPSAIVDVVGRRERLTGNLRVVLARDDYVVHTPLHLRVEHEGDLEAEATDELRASLERELRDRLLFRAEVELVPEGVLDKPGETKVNLITVEPSEART